MSRLRVHDIRRIKKFRYFSLLAMEIDETGLIALEKDPQVTSIEEDIVSFPNLYDSVKIIGADSMWQGGISGTGQAVAILDTGVDTSHEFFAGIVVAEPCFSEEDSEENSR